MKLPAMGFVVIRHTASRALRKFLLLVVRPSSPRIVVPTIPISCSSSSFTLLGVCLLVMNAGDRVQTIQEFLQVVLVREAFLSIQASK